MKVAFLYSGQGAQYPGMMSDICETYTESNSVFDLAGSVLGRDIKNIAFHGTAEELMLTHNTQPCVLAADIAAAEALKANGIAPDGVAGFSLGEYGALVESKVLDLEDAFRVIQVRADAMQEAVPLGEGKMAAFIGVSSDKVEEICRRVTDDYVIAANYNSPEQTVISGTAAGVEKAIEMAESEGIKSIPLSVSAPFHCALMKPAAERVRENVAKLRINKPVIPIYSNVTAAPFRDDEDLPEMLYKQAMSPVLWMQTMLNMYKDGFNVFVECGPGKTLSGLARKTLDKNKVRILRVSDLKTLNQTIEAIKDLV